MIERIVKSHEELTGVSLQLPEYTARALESRYIDVVVGGARTSQITSVAVRGVKVAEEIKKNGGNPYIIPGGGSNPTGALGYVNCSMELVGELNARGLKVDHLFTATGSAGTQAGLVSGMEGTRSGIPVLGICVGIEKKAQEEKVFDLVQRTTEFLEISGSINRDTVVANGDYVGPGYGKPTEGMLEAVQLLAREEGILLDPVYSGKGMAGFIDLIRRGYISKNENIVFLHTGGSTALFAYRNILTA